jgi:hypothetical protein
MWYCRCPEPLWLQEHPWLPFPSCLFPSKCFWRGSPIFFFCVGCRSNRHRKQIRSSPSRGRTSTASGGSGGWGVPLR